MATLTMTLTQAELIAALQAWVAAQPGPHQMDATVPPIINGGGVTVKLNQ